MSISSDPETGVLIVSNKNVTTLRHFALISSLDIANRTTPSQNAAVLPLHHGNQARRELRRKPLAFLARQRR